MASTKATNVSLNSFEMLGVYVVAVAFVLFVALAIAFIVYGTTCIGLESLSDSYYLQTGKVVNFAPLAKAIALISFVFFLVFASMRKR